MTARRNGDQDQRPREEASEEPSKADGREVLWEGDLGRRVAFRAGSGSLLCL